MSEDLAFDFGTCRTRVANDDGIVLFDEPTVAAVDEDTHELIAFGDEALRIGTGSAGRVTLMAPVHKGQLVDLALSEAVIAKVLGDVGVSRLSRPRVLVGIHVNETNVQRRALERSLRKAGARQVLFIEQPLACAIGGELAIEEPVGAMAIDCGAGVTDIAVMALGGMVTSASVAIGGDRIDDAIRDFVARRVGLVISKAGAGELKFELASSDARRAQVEIFGRDVDDAAAAQASIARSELASAVEEVLLPVLDAAVDCITTAPPDLANDLLASGLLLCGGGGLVDHFAERLATATGIAVHVPEHPELVAVIGAAACLHNVDAFAAVSSAPRR